MSTLHHIWRIFLEHCQRSENVLTYNLGLLFVLTIASSVPVIVNKLWKWTYYFITIAHESGHALAALLVGNRLNGIVIRHDGSGETREIGSGFFLARMWTLFWGYPFPSFVGVLYLWCSYTGWHGVALTFTLLMTFILIINIRSFVGFFFIVVTSAIIWSAWWYLPQNLVALFLYVLGWLLVFGGLRGVSNLTKHHLQGNTKNSDAYDLHQEMFIIPSFMWVLIFWILSIASLGYSFYLYFV